MNNLDYTILISSILYSIIGFIIIGVHDHNDYTFNVLSDCNIILTHVFVIPSIIIMWKNYWYMLCLVTSTVVSIIYHFSKIYTWSVSDNMEIVDMTYQHVLLVITGCIVVFSEIPVWIIPLLLFTSTFIASFGMLAVDGIYLYEILLAMLLLLYLIFLVYRFCIVPSTDRKWEYVRISIFYGIGAAFTFFIAIYMENYYKIMHCIWHVFAYTLLYFSLRSLDIGDKYVNEPSTFSGIAKLAFKKNYSFKF